MSFWNRKKSEPGQVNSARPILTTAPTQPGGSAMSEAQVKASAPGSVNLYKSAGLTLRKKGLLGKRAAVYLVLDRSISMNGFYTSGVMQDFTEKVLALSAHFDDDGIVPMFVFGDRVFDPTDIDLAKMKGVIQQMTKKIGGMGGTSYAPAIEAVTKYHKKLNPDAPGFVIFQTDGDAQDRLATEAAIKAASKEKIFWMFVGFGGSSESDFSLLNSLDNLPGRAIDNAGFWWAGRRPQDRTPEEIYDGLMNEFPEYLDKMPAVFG